MTMNGKHHYYCRFLSTRLFEILSLSLLWYLISAGGVYSFQSTRNTPATPFFRFCHRCQNQNQNQNQNDTTRQQTAFFRVCTFSLKAHRDGSSQQDLSDILANMGLKEVPVVKNQNNNNDKKKIKRNLKQRMPSKAAKHQKSSNKRRLPTIDVATQLDYARNGHAVLRNYLQPQSIKSIRPLIQCHIKEQELKAWKQKVQVASHTNSKALAESCHTVQDCQNQLQKLGITEQIPFLQFFNTWKTLPQVKHLCEELAHAASILMDVPSIRLYQDSIFWKRVNDGPTPWHVDARMAPFDTSHMITFWIPLYDVPKDGSGLIFCSKSHADFALPYWNNHENQQLQQRQRQNARQKSEWDRLDARYPSTLIDYMPMSVGDITVHSGWTLHCSNDGSGQSEHHDRVALAISYVDSQAEIRQDALTTGDNEDQWSYQDWIHDITPRRRFRHHDSVPVVWPPSFKKD